MNAAEEFFRFESQNQVGLINSPECNALYIDEVTVVCGGLRDIFVWNFKTGEQLARFSDSENNSLVTRLALKGKDVIIAGYMDGVIRVWDMKAEEPIKVIFKGHDVAVTCFALSPDGNVLASGSKDTDIVIWDILGEQAICRLSGHTNVVSSLIFIPEANNSTRFLLSCSRDMLVKVWDLRSHACIETLVQHREELTAMALFDAGRVLLTFGAGKKIGIYGVDLEQSQRVISGEEGAAILKHIGDIEREGKDRVIDVSGGEDCFGVLSSDRSVQLLRVRSAEEIKKRINRRNKRNREKLGGEEAGKKLGAEPEDMLESLMMVRCRVKSSGIDFRKRRLLLAHMDNSMAEYVFDVEKKSYEVKRALELPGHRSETRVIAIDPGAKEFYSASEECIKIWDVEGRQCRLTIDIEDGMTITAMLCTGEFLLCASKEGKLVLFDVNNGEMLLEKASAHDAQITSLHLSDTYYISGSTDKTVKFWELKRRVRSDELRLKHTRTLQLGDGVIGVRLSPDARLLAVVLLDLTVKVFFTDTLKFYLSLYGHSLPVTTLDFSPDSKFLITGSADKSVRIWGMDFGDCRRSLLQTECVTGVRFIGSDFITTCRDGCLKFWAWKGWECVQRVNEAHHREILALEAISRGGAFGERAEHILVTSGADKCLRVWKQGEDQIFIEEEREREMEQQIEEQMLSEKVDEKTLTLRTVKSMKAGERMAEFIEAADLEQQKWLEHSKGIIPVPTPGPLFQAFKAKRPEDLVWVAANQIPTPDLEQALLCLPFLHVKSLLHYVNAWLQNLTRVPLASRLLSCLIRIFFKQFQADASLRDLLTEIRDKQDRQLQELHDLVGVNLVIVGQLLKMQRNEHTAALFEKVALDSTKSRKHGLAE